MKRAVLAAMAVAMLVAGFAVRADAHSAADYYPRRWQRQLNQDWAFTASFPTGAKRDRVRNGIAQWNNLGEPQQWREVSQRTDYNPDVCPPTYGMNSIHWRNIPDDSVGALAYVQRCTFSGSTEIYSANMVFDSSRSWYDGTGDAPDGFANQICSLPPGCENDFWSVASHEWGHMTGFSGPFHNGHFNNSETICAGNDGQHTMCPAIEIGTERMRTLEDHDRHTFQNSY